MGTNKIVIISFIVSLVMLIAGIIFLIPQLTGKATFSNDDSDLESLRVGYRAHIAYLPAYIAVVDGYFEKHGFRAELIEFESTNQLVEAIVNKQIDVGVGGINTPLVWTIEEKNPGLLTSIGVSIPNDNLDAIIININSKISYVSDLDGKTVAVPPGSTPRKWIELLEKKEGIKVNIVEMLASQELGAIAANTVDAAFVLEPLITIGESKKISKVLVNSPIERYFMQDVPLETSVVSSQLTQLDPNKLRRIKSAIDDTLDFINKNPEIAKSYYAKYTDIDEEIASRLPIEQYVRSDEVNIAQIDNAINRAVEVGLLKKKIEAKDLYD